MEKVVENYRIAFELDESIRIEALTPRCSRRLVRKGPPKYVRDYITRKEAYIGWVYLLHFHEPYEHAEHYIGFTKNLDKRMIAHQTGRGARLMEVVTAAGIEFTIVMVWRGDRRFERMLKNRRYAKRLCPICREQKGLTPYPTFRR